MTTSSDGIRAFVALDLPDEARRAALDLLGPLRARLAGLRPCAPESLHVTLRFLGDDARPSQVERLVPALAEAAARCPAGTARLAGRGVFPERGAPRVLWLGLELPPPFFDLQAACERAARAAGFAAERRDFAPHLTLGRWRDRAPRPELPPCDAGQARVDRLTLFRSELGPRGARYTALHVFTLGEAR